MLQHFNNNNNHLRTLTLIIELIIASLIHQQVNCDNQQLKTFVNHRLYSVDTQPNETFNSLFNDLRESIEIDVWSEPSMFNNKLTFRVDPIFQSKVDNFLNSTNSNYYVVTNDLQKWIERERLENDMDYKNAYTPGRFHSSDFRLDYYHTYEEVNCKKKSSLI